MPVKYIRQMICDWKGIARKLGDTWVGLYEKNKGDFCLNPGTVSDIEWFIENDRRFGALT